MCWKEPHTLGNRKWAERHSTARTGVDIVDVEVSRSSSPTAYGARLLYSELARPERFERPPLRFVV